MKKLTLNVKGIKGDKPTTEELVSIIKPLIPEPVPGKNGDTPEIDYDKINRETVNIVKREVVKLPKPVVKYSEIIEAPDINIKIEEVRNEFPSVVRMMTKDIATKTYDIGDIPGLQQALDNAGGDIAFTDLTDTFPSYTGLAGKGLRVNLASNGIDTYTPTDTDEKVKYDASDPTAGYVADKFVAGTGITLAEGTGANENKLLITNTLDLSNYVEIGDNVSLLTNDAEYIPASGATTGAVSQAQAFTNGVITGKIYPSADSTTAVRILKADGTTSMMTFDTTNGQVGVGMTPQGASFQIRGATTANNYTQIWGASGASGNLSTLALIKTADASGDFVFSSFIAGGALSGAPKIHFGGYDATPINGAKITMDIANGRLGIGITSPTSPIHISTTVTTPMNIVSSDTNTVLIRSTKGANAATAQVQLQTVNRSMVFASTDQASGVAGWYDGTAGVWRMAIIHTSGNVDIGGGIATSYKLNVAGTTASTLFLSGNGTVGGPAFSFKGDTNTGMYNVSADVLGFTTAGSTRMQIGATGEIAVGTSPSAGIPFRVIKSTTQLTGAQTNIYVDGVHTLNANNAFQIRGVYSGPAINQAGFNATASISSGGAVPSFYALPQATGASGTVTNVTGFFSSARNTGAGIVSELIGFSAGAGLNTGGGSVTNVYGFYAGANTVGTNNYEFYGTTVASSGRWGFYQAGGAQNYFAGNVGFGVAPSEALEVKDAGNIKFQTTTGTKIGTATGQKIGFWNATPIVQPTTAVTAATFTANTSGIVDDTATFDGYTIGQVVAALRNAGLLA